MVLYIIFSGGDEIRCIDYPFLNHRLCEIDCHSTISTLCRGECLWFNNTKLTACYDDNRIRTGKPTLYDCNHYNRDYILKS